MWPVTGSCDPRFGSQLALFRPRRSIISTGALVVAVPPIVAVGRNRLAIEPAASAAISIGREPVPRVPVAAIMAVFALVMGVVLPIPVAAMSVMLAGTFVLAAAATAI